jgi:DNA-binding transcriptional MerR regulator
VQYSPGEVAERFGVSIDTLRYYERIGLLDGIARTSGGQRVFSDDDVSLLSLLRCLRDTGMPIARMLQFAELLRSGNETAADRAALLEEHDREIDAKVAQLRAEQRRIRDKITWYRSAGS